MEALSCKGKRKGACKDGPYGPTHFPDLLEDGPGVTGLVEDPVEDGPYEDGPYEDGPYVDEPDDYSDPPSNERNWSDEADDPDTVKITLTKGMTGEVIYSGCWPHQDPVTAGHFFGIAKNKLQVPETSITLAIGTKVFHCMKGSLRGYRSKDDSMYARILESKKVRRILAAQDGKEKTLDIQVILNTQVD